MTERIEGGLRRKGRFYKKSEPGMPLVSIITVVRNGIKHLEQTIQSVLNQTYDNIEYILVDGASTDGTLETIQNYDDEIAYWVSEPDKGIYDAMNKGIVLATGDWINFMNAGDRFYKLETIENIFKTSFSADLVYGDSKKEFKNFPRFQKAGEVSNLWKGMVFSHQSLFVKNNLLKDNMFETTNKLTSDFEFIFSMYRKHCKFHKIDTIIAVNAAEGLSNDNRITSIKERWKSVKKFDKRLMVDLYYPCLILDTIIRTFFKKIFPKKLVAYIQKNKKAYV